MVKDTYDNELWEKRMQEKTMEYHIALMDLLQKKIDTNTNGKITFTDYDEVMQTFASCVSIQRTMVDLSMKEAKASLTNAFEKCGYIIKDGIATEKNDD
tara:strand:- start:53 stop:349 length:297 start_codon:yes stop_codon:yes gene_type:complete